MELIRTDLDLCTGCNRCVRECPMEPANITYQDEDGNIKVRIDHDKCIVCGRCLYACKHSARYHVDDTERFFEDLDNGVPISLIAAPAIRTNIPEWKRMFTYFKQRGVNKIYDVSLGADICIWSNIRHVERNEDIPFITQPCPVIVTYCEMYKPDLLRYLSPAQSPMACASVYMKEYKGITDNIAALSPCVAKANEFEETELAQYSITFTRLLDYLRDNDIELPEEETDFDSDESSLGSIFPMPGGLKENIEFYTEKKVSIDRAEGKVVFDLMDTFGETPVESLPRVFDVLNCHDGCNMGTACTHTTNLFAANREMDKRREAATGGRSRDYFVELYRKYDETFDLEKFTRRYKPMPAMALQIDDNDIKHAYAVLGKEDDYEKQHVDCGACGSDTCLGMARKIALGVNIPINCIVKTMEDAKAEHELNIENQEQIAQMERNRETDELMRTMLDSNPYAANFWNRNLELIDINEATVNLLGMSDKREYIDNFGAFSPEYQPDGRLSVTAAAEYIGQTFEKGTGRYDWMLQTANGEKVPCEVVATRVDYKGEYIVAAYLRDLREQRKMLSDIEKRDKLLGVINRIASVLLAATNEDHFEDFLIEGMELIGRELDSDCVQIWPNETRDGVLHFALKYKWMSEVGKGAPPVAIGTALPYSARWKELFLRGECINGPISSLPQEDQDLLSPLALKSTVTIPLFYLDEFWGVLCVDDCVKEHYYTDDEIGILRSAALMLVNAINRNIQASQLRDTAERLKTALGNAEAAVKALEAAQSTTSAMFRANTNMNVLFDSSFNVVDCNPAALSFFGFKTKEELFAGFIERMLKSIPQYQPDGRLSIPLPERLMTAVKEGSVRFETELVMGGVKKILDVEFKRIPYEGSFAIVGYVYDMTDIREREMELIATREQNEIQLTKLNLVLQATGIGLWDMEVARDDPVNPINAIIWSDEFRRLLGFEDKKDFPNQIGSFRERIHPNDGDKVRNALIGHLMDVTGETPLDLEFRVMKKDGEYSYFRATGETIRDESGSPIHVAGSLDDITETKNILLDTEKQKLQAEAASQAKSMFLSTMSHEIRTPMNAILGIAEIQLQDEMLDPGLREGLEKIRNSGDMLLGIINDILDLSKIEAGKLELIYLKYDTASLISDTAQLNMMRIGSKPIEFDLYVTRELPVCLLGDELRVKQILNNILSNAFKYTEAGKVVMSVSAEDVKSDDEKINLVISISDTGQGMTKEQVEKLFDEYARFNHETNRTTEGTGLGMSITRTLTQMMNGEIKIESEPGVGSVFTVYLPQGKVSPEVLGKDMAENLEKFRTSSTSQMKRVQIQRDPMPYGTVMIVDDVETNIYVARGLMMPYGLAADAADSGFAAIEKIKNGNIYDIVFMDHMMPVMDGIEATKRLREMGYHQPIVALTANAVVGQAEIFLENGFDDFISKPIDVRQLNTVLNKYVRDRHPPEVVEKARQDALNNKPDITRNTIDSRFSEIFVRDAVKTISVMEEFISKRGRYSAEEMRTYVIHTHGIKSALANIGEMKLSAVALRLEHLGRGNDIEAIYDETPSFLTSLRSLVSRLTVHEEETETETEDPASLMEMLLAIQTACGEYDESAIEAVLETMRRNVSSKRTRDLINVISEKLLHSDFDEISDEISNVLKEL